MRRRRGVVAELEVELALALSGSSQLSAEAKHGVETAVRDAGKVLGADLSIVNGRGALVQEHKNVALELIGGRDVGLHEGLQHLTVGLLESLLEGHLSSQAESVIGGVSNVSRTVVDDHLDTNDLVAKERTLLARLLETLGASAEELLGNAAADDLLLKEVCLRVLVGLNPAGNTGIVSRTTRLALQEEVKLGSLANSFSVRDTGLSGHAVYLVLSAKTLDVDFEMEFSHTRNDGLLAFGVDVKSESRVLALEAVHGLTEVVGVTRLLGLDGERHDGLGNEHGRHGVREPTVGEGVTRSTVNTEDGADFAGADLVYVLQFVGVHAHNSGDPDLLARSGVEEVTALLQLALVDSDVCELAVVVLLELEGQSDKRQRVVRHKSDGFLVLGCVETQVLNLTGVRQVVADGIEDGLDTLVAESGTHHHGGKLEADGGASDSSLDLGDGRLLLVQEHLGHFIIDIGKLLDEDLPLLKCYVLELGGNLVGHPHLGASRSFEVDGLHFDNVDDTLEVALGAHGDLNSSGGNLELGVDLLNGLPGIRTHAIHLVDKTDAGDVVPLHLTVDGDGLTLHRADGAEDHDGTVKDTKSTLDLNGEVNMAWGVDEINVELLVLAILGLGPVAEGRGGLDGDTLLTLEIHGVHLGTDGILASDLVYRLDSARVEENSLSTCRFSAVDVGLKKGNVAWLDDCS